MKKGPLCDGCPAQSFSRDMVPDEIKPGAQVYLLNQNPGADEEVEGRPMIGATGQAWESKFLKDSGLSREEINIGNVIRCRWHGSNDLPPVSSILVKQAMAHCQRAYFRIPEETKLLVAAGDYACQALTGSTVADNDKAGNGWRGYLKPYAGAQYGRRIAQVASGVAISPSPCRGSSLVYQDEEFETAADRAVSRAEGPSYWLPGPQEPLPVLITWHIARTFHEPRLILPTRRDWQKIPKILKGTWPIKPPKFVEQPPQPWPQMFTFDTEFVYKWAFGQWPKGSKPPLIRYSMSWGVGDEETAVVEVDQHIPPMLQLRPRVVTQYSPADVWHLDTLTYRERTWEPHTVWDRFLIEDSVWKHAVLWSDHQHDLNYLGSLYTPFNRWKHLGESDPTLYAGMDATGLAYVDRALEAELDADPLSRRVWESIDRPALGEFVRAQYRGLRTNPDRVQGAIIQLYNQMVRAALEAQALVGWPINLASNPQVAAQLYGQEGLKPIR